MRDAPTRRGFRLWVTRAFALVLFVFGVLCTESIAALLAKRGWDQLLIDGGNQLISLGLAGWVSYALVALGGASLALWTEFWLRDKQEDRLQEERDRLTCRAIFNFSKSEGGEIALKLSDRSENVGYYRWYLNNGGTMRNHAVLLFIEYGGEIADPEIFAHAAPDNDQWRLLESTSRYLIAELKGWPTGEVSFQAFPSKALGLDRRSELEIWRPYGPLDSVPQT